MNILHTFTVTTMTKSSNPTYLFETELSGFINLVEPAGNYNCCSFRFTVPSEVIDLCEKDRENLLEVAASKVEHPNRLGISPTKWDEQGLVKYSFMGNTNRIQPVVIDEYGEPLDLEVLRSIRQGTKVEMLIEQKAYWKPTLGTTIVVHGMRVLDLVTTSSETNKLFPIETVRELMGLTTTRNEIAKAVY